MSRKPIARKMSVLLCTDDGWIFSHFEYLNAIYKSVNDEDQMCSLEFNKQVFDINSQFLRDDQIAKSEQAEVTIGSGKSRKRKRSKKLSEEELRELQYVKEAFLRLQSSEAAKKLFQSSNISDNNNAARKASNDFYSRSSEHRLASFHGCNQSDSPIITKVDNEKYVFPERCSFYSYDVKDIGQKLEDAQFDFILMDPPWWNKFIRRRNERDAQSSYKMMYNEEFADIPIEKLLSTDGLVAVWCTNAPSHLHSIVNEMFPSWGVQYVARWYWVKVTRSGNPVCNFNETSGKQPYESLIFGRKSSEREMNIPDRKVLVSVPSGVHSHKPPIAEIMNSYLPENPRCLEIFARYLLPGWTSWGLEVLKFQHSSLYARH